MSERVMCASCGRIIGGYVPRRGDGSALMPRRHKGPDGEPCHDRGLYVDWEPEDQPPTP